MPSWLTHILGLDDPNGPLYLFYSGILGDLSLVGAAYAIVRRHQCHVKWCPRLGRHQAGQFVVCARHHPDIGAAPTASDIHEQLRGQP